MRTAERHRVEITATSALTLTQRIGPPLGLQEHPADAKRKKYSVQHHSPPAPSLSEQTFPTDPTGLPEASGPQVLDLADAGTLNPQPPFGPIDWNTADVHFMAPLVDQCIHHVFAGHPDMISRLTGDAVPTLP
jgi:hypothetical protein